MELNDPELLAAVVATVGTESLEALIRSASPSTAHCSHAQPELDKLGQPQPPLPSWVEENGEATLLLQQEAELAELHQEAETTRQLIAEVHRRAEEATAASGAATTATLDQALKAVEAARLEEARHERLREDATHAAAMATDATMMEAAKTLAQAREKEHKMAVRSARALKAEHERA
jgi:hypothetical protein